MRKKSLLAQAKKENPEKPDNIIEKMIIGRSEQRDERDLSVRSDIRSGQRSHSCKTMLRKLQNENGANVTVKKLCYVSRQVKVWRRNRMISRQKLQHRRECNLPIKRF